MLIGEGFLFQIQWMEIVRDKTVRVEEMFDIENVKQSVQGRNVSC